MNLDITRTINLDEAKYENVKAAFMNIKWKFISISLGKEMDEERDNFTYLYDGMRTPQIRESLKDEDLASMREACLRVENFPEYVRGLVTSILDLVDFEINKREVYGKGIEDVVILDDSANNLVKEA